MTIDDVEAFAATLHGAQIGEGWAFTGLFEMFEPAVSGFVRSRGVADGDDVVNDVFLAVFNGIRSFSGGEPEFRAWLFRITRNKVADWFRGVERRHRQLDASGAELMTRTAGVDQQDYVADSLAVDGLLSALTDEQREVLLLRVMAGLTGPQTAELLGKPLSAVKALQRRALLSLRREIGAQAVSN